VRRHFDLGILHDRDRRLADALLHELATDRDVSVRRNEPYGPADGVTHTLKLHGLTRGLLNVMLEIRNDLIGDEAGQRRWAERLACAMTAACQALDSAWTQNASYATA
jgi:predicted N-formylglutamate amidohydrolase